VNTIVFFVVLFYVSAQFREPTAAVLLSSLLSFVIAAINALVIVGPKVYFVRAYYLLFSRGTLSDCFILFIFFIY
jgi:hypothetical protein